MSIAKHSGKIGDCLYSLPVVRQLGIKTLYVNPNAEVDPLTVPVAEQLCELLRLQPYLDTVEVWNGQPFDIDLDRFRDIATQHTREHLVNAHWKGLGRFDPLDTSPWLTVPSEPCSALRVVINRSLRNPGQRFPWVYLMDRVRERLGEVRPVFVGTLDEFAVWRNLCSGRSWYCPTSTLLDFAKVIASADLFIGNQSAGWVIAEGIDKRRLLELNPRHPCANPLTSNGTTSADIFLNWLT